MISSKSLRQLLLTTTLLLAGGRLQATDPVWYYSHFAGSTKGGGYRDGVGQAAKFNGASGIAFDGSGNAYVCDSGNCVIRKISPAGVVTTWVGQAGVSALVDGRGADARFLAPEACAFDAAGVLYVADAMALRKITADGQVSTLAGSSVVGSADGSGAGASFKHIAGLAVDSAGTIYASDLLSGTVRKITAAGEVSTLAGSAGIGGTTDGVGSAARFQEIRGLTLTPTGALVAVDGGLIRKITTAGVVSTLAGEQSSSYDLDGSLSVARFYGAQGITADAAGNLYVTTYYYVRKIATDGTVTTLAGSSSPSVAGSDGTGGSANFTNPCQLACGPDGSLYVAENSPGRIRRVTLSGVVTTMAGSLPEIGSTDGAGSAAQFSRLGGADLDAAGNLYVADSGNHTIRKITPAGVVTTLAGSAGQVGSADGVGSSARFNFPMDVAVDDDGTIYVADCSNHTVRKITAAGAVTTLAGAVGQSGGVDGVGAAAHFDSIQGIASDGHGTVYVCDRLIGTIRKITSDGTVTTIAGSGVSGFADGAGAAAQFFMPTDLAVDRDSGNIYVADTINFRVRKVTPAGVVTTLAGSQGGSAPVDGVGAAAEFVYPNGGIAVDAGGNVLVADDGMIRRVTPSGSVTTLSRKYPCPRGSASGPGTAALFEETLFGITVNRATGDFYFCDSENSTIRKASLVTPAISWTPPAAITYGAALSATQLNATTNIEGDYAVYTYSPAAGTRLEAGTHTLNVTYSVPSAPEVPALSTSVTLTVNPVTPTITWSQPASISFGTALSAAQLNATSSIDGTFTYSPALGSVLEIGSRELSVTFTPRDTNNYTTATARVNLTVTAAQLAGTYFGTFGSDHGRWALSVNADNTALFIGYLSSRSSAIVLTLTIGADGTFSTTGTELLVASAGASVAQSLSLGTGGVERLAATGFTFSGRIVGAALTGELSGLAETLSGTADRASGSAAAGVYEAVALNTASGESHAIVAASGQAMVVVVSATGADGATGTVAANGVTSLTTLKGGSLAMNLSTAGTLAATLTPAGSTTAVSFAGLADGVTSTSRAVNIAARAYCGKDNAVTIGGFVVSGSAKKRVLVRAVGPSLTKQGLSASEVLADPTIEVHDYSHGNTTLTTNDNWGDNTNAAEITATAKTVGASELLASDTASAGALLELDPGIYTFVVKGKNDTSGIVLLEVYDADATSTGTTFTNIATRAYATTGNGVAIGGFVVNGNAPKRVLLRALGPTLTTQGLNVSEVLTNPVIELHDALNANAKIAENDDWGTNTNAASITTTAARIGATPIAQSDTKSAALLLNLQPGVYTFIASGNATAPSGIVLVEVYDAD